MALVATFAILGAGFLGVRHASPPTPAAIVQPGMPGVDSPPRPADAHAMEIDLAFREGVVFLQARRFDRAATAFHEVLRYAPRMPEAHVNMGYAMIGLGRHAAARDFFEGATALRPQQANAYYGLALALESLGDRPGAIGAMRTFVHLSPPDDPHRARAEAALDAWKATR